MSEIRLIHGDALTVLSDLPGESVDMVCADPPYGTTACKWDTIIPLEPLWRELKRIIKPRGAVVMTASQPFTTTLISSNREWFRYDLVWDKVNRYTGVPNANRMPLRRHETVLVFYRQLPTFNKQHRPGPSHPALVQHVPGFGRASRDAITKRFRVANNGLHNPCSIIAIKGLNRGTEEGFHPTQKPVALMEYLIRTYTHEGETVLDFCFGSGTTAIASMRTGRHFVGCEKEAEYVAIAQARIDAERLKEPLLAGVTP